MKKNKHIEEEMEFLKSLNYRNFCEKVESRLKQLETQKLVNAEVENNMMNNNFRRL